MKAFLERYPALLIVVFTLCWLGMDTFYPRTGVPVYEVVWARYGIYLGCMAIVFGPRQGTRLIRTSRLKLQIAGSLCMLGMPLLYIWAFRHASPTNALSVLWLAPLMVVAFSLLSRRDRADTRTWVATVAGLIGALCIYHPDGDILNPSSLFAFGSALCLALYVVAIRSLQNESVLTKLFHTGLWVFVGFSIGLPLYWQMPTPQGAFYMLLIGFLEWGALYAIIVAIKNESPAALAPALYTKLFWDALVKWPSQSDAGDVRVTVGLTLVVAAISVALFRRNNLFAASRTLSAERA